MVVRFPQTLRSSMRVAVGALAFIIVWGTFSTTRAAAGGGAPWRPAPSTALTIDVQAVQGFAVPGTSTPVTVLVVVTDRHTGAAVTTLAQSDFAVLEPPSTPGAICGFSGGIHSFLNVLNGGYRLTITPRDGPAPGCTWVPANYVGRLAVAAGAKQGQAAFKLSIE